MREGLRWADAGFEVFREEFSEVHIEFGRWPLCRGLWCNGRESVRINLHGDRSSRGLHARLSRERWLRIFTLCRESKAWRGHTHLYSGFAHALECIAACFCRWTFFHKIPKDRSSCEDCKVEIIKSLQESQSGMNTRISLYGRTSRALTAGECQTAYKNEMPAMKRW